MNKEKIRDQLIIDEGYRNKAYRDMFGNLTIGIGHLIIPSDGIFENDTISDERVDDLFQHDLLHAEIACRGIIKDFHAHPEEVQNALVNMCFNLGATRFAKFKNLIEALSLKDYATAANEMRNSKWYTQVGARGERLASIVENKKQ